MGIIKIINLNGIEDCLKEVVGLSFQAKLFEEEYNDVINQMKDSKSGLSSGNISKDVYAKNMIMLESEKKRLLAKINGTIDRMEKVIETVQKIIKENAI